VHLVEIGLLVSVKDSSGEVIETGLEVFQGSGSNISLFRGMCVFLGDFGSGSFLGLSVSGLLSLLSNGEGSSGSIVSSLSSCLSSSSILESSFEFSYKTVLSI